MSMQGHLHVTGIATVHLLTTQLLRLAIGLAHLESVGDIYLTKHNEAYSRTLDNDAPETRAPPLCWNV